MKFSSETSEKFKFGIVGAINTSLTYLLYLILTDFTSAKVAYYIAYIVGIGFAVVANITFTFAAKLRGSSLLYSAILYLAAMFFGGQIVSILTDRYYISPEVSGVVAISVTAMIAFIGMRYISRRPIS